MRRPPLPITRQLINIPNGVNGVKATLRTMGRLVKEGKTQVPVRALAVKLTGHLQPKDWRGEVNALFTFVRDQIRYIKDTHNVELLHDPVRILHFRAGDCDDKSILLAALLESIGHPTRFKAIAINNNRLSHVIVETKLGQNWVSLDATEPVCMGWSPKNITGVMYYHN